MENGIIVVRLVKSNLRVDIEKRGKSPNCCNKLICIINLGNCEIELRIVKLGNYGIKWCSWIILSISYENVDIISVDAFIFCLDITALGYRWRIVLNAVDNA